MQILLREPVNQPLQVMEIDDKFATMQKLVGGYIQAIGITEGIVCLIDEDGRAKGLDNNFYHDRYGAIIGNCVFCGTKGEDFIGLTDTQVLEVADYLGCAVIEKK